MEHTREHLGRDDMEAGFADVAGKSTVVKKAAVHMPVPEWLMSWEDKRPRFVSEIAAEMIGVFTYVYCGVGSSIALYLSIATKTGPAFGNLLTIGLAYGVGIIIAILIAGPVSGGHLSPSYTIAFWAFRGFPGRKVPYYIAAQIFGAFVAAGLAYAIYSAQLRTVAAGLTALGEASVIISSNGPAGNLAIFRGATQSIGYVFLNEFVACTFLSLAVFTVLDPSNIFVSFSSAPVFIGIAYAVTIWGFAGETLVLNSARDIGGRLACSAVYGTGCFNNDSAYTALAALANIPATLLGAAIQILLLSDSARPIAIVMPDPEGPSMRIITREITRDEKR